MRWELALVAVLLVAVVMVGCIQQEQKPTTAPEVAPSEPTEPQVTSEITMENISNGNDLNDTSEIGYVEEVEPF